jgi:Antitoxin MazE-like
MRLGHFPWYRPAKGDTLQLVNIPKRRETHSIRPAPVQLPLFAEAASPSAPGWTSSASAAWKPGPIRSAKPSWSAGGDASALKVVDDGARAVGLPAAGDGGAGPCRAGANADKARCMEAAPVRVPGRGAGAGPTHRIRGREAGRSRLRVCRRSGADLCYMQRNLGVVPWRRRSPAASGSAARLCGPQPLQIWVPDTRKPEFAEECRRQARRVAEADLADQDLQAFMEAARVDLDKIVE